MKLEALASWKGFRRLLATASTSWNAKLLEMASSGAGISSDARSEIAPPTSSSSFLAASIEKLHVAPTSPL